MYSVKQTQLKILELLVKAYVYIEINASLLFLRSRILLELF